MLGIRRIATRAGSSVASLVLALAAFSVAAGCGDSGPCAAACGDGVVSCQEQCDDWNLEDGDGCSSSCLIEPCRDEDRDGHPAAGCGGDDCDDFQPAIHPGTPESLDKSGCDDGLDNDCDGFTDALDLGCWPCFSDAECDDLDTCNGEERCASGACQSGTPLACDDGLFCDGVEVCDPVSGCGPGVLPCPDEGGCVRCREDVDSCFEDPGTPCGGPADSVCDHPDLCDGQGGCAPSLAEDGTLCDDLDPCSTHDSCLGGVCAAGLLDLDEDGDGYVAAACGGEDCDDQDAAVSPAATEWLVDASCGDGIDNDCDGTIDEVDPEGGGPCDTGESGSCALGSWRCVEAVPVCVRDQEPGLEVCNGIDDDCDGSADEDDPGWGEPCNTGQGGSCEAGQMRCRGSELRCVALLAEEPDLCNGLDDNCDGFIDTTCPTLMWSRLLDRPTGDSAMALGNLDEDSDLEVVLGTSEGSVIYPGMLYALNPDGTDLPGWPLAIKGLPTAPAIVDLDEDQASELVYFNVRPYTEWPPPYGELSAMEVDGTLLPGWPALQELTYSSPAVGDVNGGGHLEVFIGEANSCMGGSGAIIGLSRDGAPLPGWPKQVAGQYCHQTPALGDLDGDGLEDIVVGCQDDRMQAWNHAGQDIEGWPSAVLQASRVPPVLGDLDSDGMLEVVTVGHPDGSPSDSYLYVLESDGRIKEGWPVPVFRENLSSCIALGHIDGDGFLDVVYGGYALDRNGASLPGWPLVPGLSQCSVLLDIDNDDLSEIIQKCDGGDSICMYDGDGRLLPGGSIWVGSQIDFLAAGDLDGDGRLEIIASSYNSTTLVAYRLGPGSYNPEMLEWPMFQHDSRHSGTYPP